MVLAEQLHVTGVIVRLGGLERLELGQHLRIHRGHQHVGGVVAVGRVAGHVVRDDQPFEVLLVRESVLDGQQAAPGLAVEEEVVGIESQSSPHLLDFVDKALDGPQIRIVRLIAVAGAELVVEVELDPRLRKVILEVEQVVVGGSGTTVEQQDLDVRILPRATGPDLEAAAGRFDRNATNTRLGRDLVRSRLGFGSGLRFRALPTGRYQQGDAERDDVLSHGRSLSSVGQPGGEDGTKSD